MKWRPTMIIRREKYLNDLILRMHNGMIKVITGISQSGKTYLLFNIFTSYLESTGVDRSHIISIQLDFRKNTGLRNPDQLLAWIEPQIKDNQSYYILIDEVQMLDDFEAVLNQLSSRSNVDLYVTRSNSRFLSRDVLTEFRGRGDEIQIYPLTFKEFCTGYRA
jgi:predicted AAA+ superfamily ATPase